MSDSDPETRERRRALQARINAALRESPEDRAATRFTPYRFVEREGVGLSTQLMNAASVGGLEGMEAALDKFDQLAGAGEDMGELRYELMRFLTQNPNARKLDLRIPDIEERSAWKVIPSSPASDEE